MAENPTTGELYKAKAILETDVVAAVDAFMVDPTTTLFVFGDGYRLDLAAAVRSHRVGGHDGQERRGHRAPEARRRAHRDPAGPAGEAVRRPPIRGRALKALRAVALHPRGLRLSAHSSATPALIELGYVVERQARWEGAKPRDLGRFITPAGRELLKALGAEEMP
jgi:hypothetical protein